MRRTALEDWRELVLKSFAFPLKYNYAMAQVHYAFSFSLPHEVGPHAETHTQISVLVGGL